MSDDDKDGEGNVVPFAEKTGEKQRGRPFQRGESGNPAGRPKGARHRTTLMLEALLDEEAADVARAVIGAAKNGDVAAARLVLDRLLPPRRGRTVELDLPALATAADLMAAQARVVAAVGDGSIATDEATDISELLEAAGRAMERSALETRIVALEEAKGSRK